VTGMHTLRIEHRVQDYDRWKQVFDSDPADRKGSGVRAYRVMRAVDDPDLVLIDLDFDTVDAAQAMHQKMLGIWEGPGKAVMVSPTARVVESVEAAQP
jgi:hypothetical protein